jgi:predicted secreted hydrolase
VQVSKIRVNDNRESTSFALIFVAMFRKIFREDRIIFVTQIVHKAGIVGLLLFVIIGATGCANRSQAGTASADVVEMLSGDVDTSFARAYEPIPFDFPKDHGAHPAFRTEWWYYTGNVQDDSGREYGFQLTFFRTALSASQPERASTWATNQIYMAHLAVTDGPAKQHYSFDRFSRGGKELAGATGEPVFAVWLEDWSAQTVEPGVVRLQASAQTKEGPVAIDLVLRETRAPVLHGDRGLSQKGPEPGNASYYYSLVNLDTRGAITTPAGQVNVTGLSWMDHEFGTSALSDDAVGWDWFSAQLSNKAVLMFAQVRSRSGDAQDIFTGTLVYPDGRQAPIRPEDFVLTSTGEWTSPKTGITYPSGWQVTFPAYELQLTIDPLIQDQEMNVTFVYFEGATRLRGTMNGEPVEGRGYVELTGYGSTDNSFGR